MSITPDQCQLKHHDPNKIHIPLEPRITEGHRLWCHGTDHPLHYTFMSAAFDIPL